MDTERVASAAGGVTGGVPVVHRNGETRLAAAEADKIELAKHHMAIAKNYFDRRLYQEALREFMLVNYLIPKPELQYNIGLCYEFLGKPEQAIRAHTQYLNESPHASDREEVQLWVRILEKQLLATQAIRPAGTKQPSRSAKSPPPSPSSPAAESTPPSRPIKEVTIDQTWQWELAGAVVERNGSGDHYVDGDMSEATQVSRTFQTPSSGIGFRQLMWGSVAVSGASLAIAGTFYVLGKEKERERNELVARMEGMGAVRRDPATNELRYATPKAKLRYEGEVDTIDRKMDRDQAVIIGGLAGAALFAGLGGFLYWMDGGQNLRLQLNAAPSEPGVAVQMGF